MTNSDWALVLFCIVQLLVTCAGLYFKQYLIKKGDIKATNENFNQLKKQLDETTVLTKSIEGKLTNKAWLHQKRWEIKKDFYMESLTLFNTMNSHFNIILGHLFHISDGKLSIDEINELDNKIDHGLNVISSLKDKLKGIVALQGAIFLGESTLTAINKFIDPHNNEFMDPFINRDMFSGLSSSNELKNDFLNQLIGSCNIAREELLREAKKDLNLVWDE
ncbi:hypothetical protein WNY51_00175 [Pseudocolwellia sp. AS88]|uniref:hypothetical protein n=1 Tax=Pseudocolwellia sp. AS88 TaxID=3063958 RepID=UPI0026EE03C4|nr:hypothetical protein [Pseudocolwellia sp. AS88]MDO7084755.1 hypothetical protein [Pseudocolwellia sp. AS88]